MSVETSTGNRPPVVSELALDDAKRVSLCEVLDRVLNKGVVVAGDVTISVADVDLIYLGLQLVLTSMEKARQGFRRAPVQLDADLGIEKELASGFR
ncbi:MAG: gas vesicle protein [Acidobacteriia bacterium]|nr:gas vesicle protein [Terriglobia bacterium]